MTPRSFMNMSDMFSLDMNQTFDDHYLSFNSPATSPKKRLHQTVYKSLLFWKRNIQIQSLTIQQKLSDKIFEMISIKTNDVQREMILDFKFQD